MEPLLTYFEGSLIGRMRGGRRRVPKFQLSLWNCFHSTAESLARTNNSVEGWNNRFNLLLGAHHPTIWKLIDGIKLEQSNIEFEINQIRAGTPAKKRKRIYNDLNERLVTNITRHGTITSLEYVLGIAQNIHF